MGAIFAFNAKAKPLIKICINIFLQDLVPVLLLALRAEVSDITNNLRRNNSVLILEVTILPEICIHLPQDLWVILHVLITDLFDNWGWQLYYLVLG